jgi:1,4-alpha-glucan branching enzyme
MKRSTTPTGKARVTFELPAEVPGDRIALCGDFNDWSDQAHLLKARKDGSRAVTVTLAPGTYRFRYLVDGTHWVNDWAADAYEPNGHGSDDSIVQV